MEERKINFKNIIVGIILMAGCITIGAISTIPHQSEIITTIINVPAQFTEQKDTVSQESVEVALQTNQGVINVMTITTLFKVIVIVSVASIVFVLLSSTGLVPRFGGMGD